jgi:hypothetical protein
MALVAISLYVAWRAREASARALLFSCLLLASLVVSPFSLDYHYTLALLPLAILWGRVISNRDARLAALTGLATCLLLVDLPQRPLFDAHGFGSLLAYPKLYGALLLWALGIWLTWSGSVEREAAAARLRQQLSVSGRG